MPGETVTVDCLNFGACGGQLRFRLLDEALVTRGGTAVTTRRAVPVRRTCRCAYSDRHEDALAGRAIDRGDLERR